MKKQKAVLKWDDVLKRKDLIGGDIESVEDDVVYRGPLSKINAEDELIWFTVSWCAKMNDKGEWEKWNITSGFVNKTILPQDIGEGRVFFMTPCLGSTTLFPRGGSKLDPNKVKGLPKASERLLALYPNLQLDREVAGKILTGKSWPHQAKALLGLKANATLRNLLATFRHDSSAEEFLWEYIEAVTNEKDVHCKVY
jgi:hypothetical protein